MVDDSMTILDCWAHRLREDPSAPAVYDHELPVSYQAMENEIQALAALIVDAGVGRGDRVAVCLQNVPDYAVVLLAVWQVDAVAVPINPMVRDRELNLLLSDSGSSLLICADDFYQQVANAVVADVDVLRVLTRPGGQGPWTSTYSCHPPKRSAHREAAPIGTAMLVYTSGTTGPPKGAMISHAGLAHNGQMVVSWYQLSEQDVIIALAPLFHITGLVIQLAASVFAGAPLVLFGRFDPQVALQLIERLGVTFSIAAITAYIALLDQATIATTDLTTWRTAVSGGAPVPSGVVQRFEHATGLYILNGYGLTETTAPSILTPLGQRAPVDSVSGALSVGRAVPGAVVRIRDLDTGAWLGQNQEGEIAIAGPMVVSGYWRRPEETAQAIESGFLRTGDIGLMDGDGWVYVVDRAKDQINASGYKVWPREVEDVLYEHPAVLEAAVVGAADEYRGETVVAFVVAISGQPVDSEALSVHCRTRLSSYKCPREYHFVAELPKTLTGKVLRRELRTVVPSSTDSEARQ